MSRSALLKQLLYGVQQRGDLASPERLLAVPASSLRGAEQPGSQQPQHVTGIVGNEILERHLCRGIHLHAEPAQPRTQQCGDHARGIIARGRVIRPHLHVVITPGGATSVQPQQRRCRHRVRGKVSEQFRYRIHADLRRSAERVERSCQVRSSHLRIRGIGAVGERRLHAMLVRPGDRVDIGVIASDVSEEGRCGRSVGSASVRGALSSTRRRITPKDATHSEYTPSADATDGEHSTRGHNDSP